MGVPAARTTFLPRKTHPREKQRGRLARIASEQLPPWDSRPAGGEMPLRNNLERGAEPEILSDATYREETVGAVLGALLWCFAGL